MNITEFRKQYPEYDNVSDDKLAKSLHQKHYSHVSYDEFASKFLGSSKPADNEAKEIFKNLPFEAKNQIASDGLTVSKNPDFFRALPLDTQKQLIKSGKAGEYGIKENDQSMRSQTQGEMVGIQQKRALETATQKIIPSMHPSLQGRNMGIVNNLVRRNVLQTAGAQAGEFVGQKFGGRPGAIAGGGLGGAAGKVIQEGLEKAAGRNPYKTKEQIAIDVLKAGGVEGATSAVGEGIGMLGGKMLGGKKVINRAIKANENLMQHGAHLTPAQMTEPGVLHRLENMAEKAFGGDSIVDLKSFKQPTAIRAYAGKLAKKFADGLNVISDSETGRLLKDSISGGKKAFYAVADKMYRGVDNAGKGTPVDIRHLKRYSGQLLKKNAAKSNIGLSDTAHRMLERITQLGDKVDFPVARELRSDFIKNIDEFTSKDTSKYAKLFTKFTDQRIEKSLVKAGNKEAVDLWRGANKFYKEGAEQFNSDFTKELLKKASKDPHKVVDLVFEDKADNQIKMLKGMLADDPKTWKQLKLAYTDKLLKGVYDAGAETYKGSHLLTKLKNMGEPALKEIFDGDELKAITDFADAAYYTQRHTLNGGGMLIQATQAGAAMNMAAGTGKAGGLSKIVLLGPAAVSKIFITNPKMAKLLTEGIKMPRTNPRANALAIRIMREFNKQESTTNSQKSKQE